MSVDNSVKKTLVECLSQQLDEFELLKSMYPNENEIVLTYGNSIHEMENFVNKNLDTKYIPNNLDFVINLYMNNLKLEMCINLPNFYPKEEPDIYIRCNQLNREQETMLNTELLSYIKSNHSGEANLYTGICWLQDNIDAYSSKVVSDSIPKGDFIAVEENTFLRLWIFSHHIYNKKKREDIVKLAKEFNLTGFSLPGKPGIICVEGKNMDCMDWWKIIKSMNWKKITLRQTDTFDIEDQINQQKFFKFEELHFQGSSAKHSDMSEFLKFLEERGLSTAFNDLFGFP